jgi:competence protein ComEC
MEFHNFKTFTQFDSNIVDARVLKQYQKTKVTKKGKTETYQMLKLKSAKGFHFYTAADSSLENIVGKKVKLELYGGKINFYEYMSSFYAYSKILNIEGTLKEQLNTTIATAHSDLNSTKIYQALYTATPLSKELQTNFSKLGISHLFALSGFHLGVLSALLFSLLKLPYKFLQNRYFPYRNANFDLFYIVLLLLFTYLLFLDSPASLLRSFALLLVGFVLYDRGYKIISMQTLLLSVLLLLALFPRLILELGFWLSVSGVFSIFLFLMHFKHLHKKWQFLLLPLWVYLLMLPLSLVIFGNFTLYHPLSILWSTLFTLFYPLSILLHFIGFGDIFDGMLMRLISLGETPSDLSLPSFTLYFSLLFASLSLWKKSFIWLLLLWSLAIFLFAIYQFIFS